jgi:transcriptional regulator with XRE-family HTH domain
MAMADEIMMPDVRQTLERVRGKMKPWGISIAFLATRLRVSRQYIWQAVNHRTHISPYRAGEIERAVDAVIAERAHMKTFGARLRAARLSAGLTLKEVAAMIGYSWVGVERWERDICLPKPGVLWHLFSLYGVSGNPVLHEVGMGGHRRLEPVPGLPGERIRAASLQGSRGNNVGRRRKSSKHPSDAGETPSIDDNLPPAE